MPVDIYSNKYYSFQANEKIDLSAGYQRALELFWANDTRSVIDIVTASIEQNTHSSEVFQFYRLWIELLAVNNEMDSLMSLRDHLFVRSYSEDNNKNTWLALRGLVHYELDEMQAVNLIARSIGRCSDNPYCMELDQKVQFRQSDANMKLPLLNCKSGLIDYFHWDTLAKNLLITRNKHELSKVLNFVESKYARSPLKLTYELNSSFEENDYFGAKQAINKLINQYPENLDYKIQSAYISYKTENYEKCLEELNLLGQDVLNTDADAASIYGYCNLMLANKMESSSQREIAQTYLCRSKDLIDLNGFDSSSIQNTISIFEDPSENNANVVDADLLPQIWMIPISQSQYYKYANSDDDEIDRIFWSMGSEAKPGDLVFFAVGNANHPSNNWKVLSMYSVGSGPVRHPIYKYQNELDLIYRMRRPVAIDVQLLDEGLNLQGLTYEDPFKFGVYNMDFGALDMITEAIKQRNDEHDESLFGILSNFKFTA